MNSSTFSPCAQYTSDRDPRITVHACIDTATGHGQCCSTHTFWSLREAQEFARLIVEAPVSVAYRAHELAASVGPNATAERLTTAEVAWLCTPLATDPEPWTVRPRMLREMVDDACAWSLDRPVA